MMAQHTSILAAAMALAMAGTIAGTSNVSAQTYSQNRGYSQGAPQGYLPPPGYASRQHAQGYGQQSQQDYAPDFDDLGDERSAPQHAAPQGMQQGAAPLGPVMSPDDPRYGRPATITPQGYANAPNRQPQNAGVQRGPDGNFIYPGEDVRPSQTVGAYSGTTGAVDPRHPPVQTSLLPPEDQPETGPVEQLPPHLRKQEVDYASKEPPGTLVVDTDNTYLYLVLGGGRAMRYGVRVGREGSTWSGTQKISRRAEWPDWHPPAEMIERQPYLPRFMAGGPGNPMGARALYLGSTLYRIHGTNQPSTIGKYVSSGCIGMLNEDVMDLYDRVKTGARVVVLPPSKTRTPAVASSQSGSRSSGSQSAPMSIAAGEPAMSPAPGTSPSVVPPLPAPVTVR